MKNLTFQGIFELQIDLEEKLLASHTCLRYSKGPPGSHNSSAHRIMCIRRVERNIFRFGASPQKRALFLGGNGANGESGPETYMAQSDAALWEMANHTPKHFYAIFIEESYSSFI